MFLLSLQKCERENKKGQRVVDIIYNCERVCACFISKMNQINIDKNEYSYVYKRHINKVVHVKIDRLVLFFFFFFYIDYVFDTRDTEIIIITTDFFFKSESYQFCDR